MKGPLILVALLVACGVSIVAKYRNPPLRPGSVYFETADGTHGTIYVADVDHPIPELTAKIFQLRSELYRVPRLKITGEFPKVIVTKATPVE